MITSQQEYRTTKAHAERFQQALESVDMRKPTMGQMHPLPRKAQQDALRSELRELRAEIREYESLRISSPDTV
jgi:hypothetical protein